jgi:hypothetical protein
MRRFFLVLGALAILTIGGGVVAMGILWSNGRALDSESQLFADDTVIAVSSHWSKAELLKRASPEFLAMLEAKQQDLDALFDDATIGLGPLADYQGAKGQAFIAAVAGKGTIISAQYLARARFQKGSAAIQLVLQKIDGRWMVYGFYVKSTAMMNNLVERSS